jgi:hypothetical protein
MDTEEKIKGALMSPALRDIALELHAASASIEDINASQISLAEKQLLRDIRSGAATVESIGALPVDFPGIKALVLAGFSVVVALTGVSATGTPGSLGDYDALTGVSGIGTVGSVAVNWSDAASFAISGVAAVGSVGTVTDAQS